MQTKCYLNNWLECIITKIIYIEAEIIQELPVAIIPHSNELISR